MLRRPCAQNDSDCEQFQNFFSIRLERNFKQWLGHQNAENEEDSKRGRKCISADGTWEKTLWKWPCTATQTRCRRCVWRCVGPSQTVVWASQRPALRILRLRVSLTNSREWSYCKHWWTAQTKSFLTLKISKRNYVLVVILLIWFRPNSAAYLDQDTRWYLLPKGRRSHVILALFLLLRSRFHETPDNNIVFNGFN